MTKILEKKLITTVRHAVAESIRDVLTDPDYGLEITPAVRSRLARYRRQKTHHLTSLSILQQRFS